MFFGRHWTVRCVVITLVVAALAGSLLAQGSGSSRLTPSAPRQPTVEEFATSFWQFINRSESPYQKWSTIEAEVAKGVEDEHGAPRTTYMNDVAAKNKPTLPFGSVLVRPDYGRDGKTVQSVSVMYRVKAADPTKLEWYWLRFLPNGQIARIGTGAGNRPLAGHVKSCIDCHQKASGGDFVFFDLSAGGENKK